MGDRDTVFRRLRRRLLGERLVAAMKERRISRRTRRSPDRRLLVEEILPPFARRGGRILWVGCRRYTDDYPAILEACGAQCWTTDIDPQAARFGHRLRHRTGDLTAIDTLFPDIVFDTVLCNGVLGYGVDSPEAQRAALAAIAAILAPGGLLLLGWNTHKIADPLVTEVGAAFFRPIEALGLPARRRVPDSTHVYDLLARLG